MWFLAIFLVITFFEQSVICQTKEEIQNNPNDFFMFENFDLIRSVYINETKIIKKIKELRQNLLERRNNVRNILKETEISKCDSPNHCASDLKNFSHKMDSLKTVASYFIGRALVFLLYLYLYSFFFSKTGVSVSIIYLIKLQMLEFLDTKEEGVDQRSPHVSRVEMETEPGAGPGVGVGGDWAVM